MQLNVLQAPKSPANLGMFFLKFHFKVLTTTKRTRDVIEKIYRGPGNFRENDTLFGIFLGFFVIFWDFLDFSFFRGCILQKGVNEYVFEQLSTRSIRWRNKKSKNIFLQNEKMENENFGTFFNYNVNPFKYFSGVIVFGDFLKTFFKIVI